MKTSHYRSLAKGWQGNNETAGRTDLQEALKRTVQRRSLELQVTQMCRRAASVAYYEWLIIQFREGLGQLRSLLKIDSGSNMGVRW